jgi:hypothetical protein
MTKGKLRLMLVRSIVGNAAACGAAPMEGGIRAQSFRTELDEEPSFARDHAAACRPSRPLIYFVVVSHLRSVPTFKAYCEKRKCRA